MKTDQQIINEAAVKIGELVHPAACLDGFKEIIRAALQESAEAARAAMEHELETAKSQLSLAREQGSKYSKDDFASQTVMRENAVKQRDEALALLKAIYEDGYNLVTDDHQIQIYQLLNRYNL